MTRPKAIKKTEVATPMTAYVETPCDKEIPYTKYDLQELREKAISMTVQLFCNTSLGEVLGEREDKIIDIPFYYVVNEVYEFMKTGVFPSYVNFLKEQHELQARTKHASDRK